MEETKDVTEAKTPDQRTGNQVFNPAQGNVSFKPVDDVPYETVPLPSRGSIYPEGSALHCEERIDIRVMTAREEDILTSQALIKRGTVLTELLRSCIMNPNIDVNEMIAGDRNAIMVALRITGYGADYPAEIECSSCSHRYEHDFDLSRLGIKRLEIEPAGLGQNLFGFKLPMSETNVLFKFLTGQDQEEIEIIQDKMKRLGNLRDSFVTTKLKACIMEIDGVEDKAQISRFVDRMRAGDSKALRRYMDKNEPGILMRQDASCPACGYTEEVGMPLGPQFFWPE